MKNQSTYVHGITPEQLKKEILEGVSKQLLAFSNQFTPKEPEVWITRKETSELLGVSLVTIHNWTKQQIIKDYKIGNRIRFNRNEIEQILKSSSL